MPEPIDAIPPQEAIKPKLEPVGVRILGEVDPQTLSPKAFNSSPDILYHGTAKDFEFTPVFDYRSEEYLKENDGSTTIGFGFYATANQAEAENYSIVRGHKRQNVVVARILPFKARVLDLRATTNHSRNAPIPRDLAVRWQQYYMDYYRTKTPREGFLGQILDSSEAEYASYLGRVMKLDEIDLRVMLETAPSRKLGGRNLPSPYWTMLFSDFMLKEGFDGVIYNEGGEGQSKQGGASYLFYNLEKIGTYASWQKYGHQTPSVR